MFRTRGYRDATTAPRIYTWMGTPKRPSRPKFSTDATALTGNHRNFTFFLRLNILFFKADSSTSVRAKRLLHFSPLGFMRCPSFRVLGYRRGTLLCPRCATPSSTRAALLTSDEPSGPERYVRPVDHCRQSVPSLVPHLWWQHLGRGSLADIAFPILQREDGILWAGTHPY